VWRVFFKQKRLKASFCIGFVPNPTREKKIAKKQIIPFQIVLSNAKRQVTNDNDSF